MSDPASVPQPERASHSALCRAGSAKNYPQAVNILVDTWWISTDLRG